MDRLMGCWIGSGWSLEKWTEIPGASIGSVSLEKLSPLMHNQWLRGGSRESRESRQRVAGVEGLDPPMSRVISTLCGDAACRLFKERHRDPGKPGHGVMIACIQLLTEAMILFGHVSARRIARPSIRAARQGRTLMKPSVSMLFHPSRHMQVTASPPIPECWYGAG